MKALLNTFECQIEPGTAWIILLIFGLIGLLAAGVSIEKNKDDSVASVVTPIASLAAWFIVGCLLIYMIGTFPGLPGSYPGGGVLPASYSAKWLPDKSRYETGDEINRRLERDGQVITLDFRGMRESAEKP